MWRNSQPAYSSNNAYNSSYSSSYGNNSMGYSSYRQNSNYQSRRLGSYRVRNYDSEKLTDILSKAQQYKQYIPTSISLRQQTVHLTPIQLRTEDYYILRKKEAEEKHCRDLDKCIDKKIFNSDLLRQDSISFLKQVNSFNQNPPSSYDIEKMLNGTSSRYGNSNSTYGSYNSNSGNNYNNNWLNNNNGFNRSGNPNPFVSNSNNNNSNNMFGSNSNSTNYMGSSYNTRSSSFMNNNNSYSNNNSNNMFNSRGNMFSTNNQSNQFGQNNNMGGNNNPFYSNNNSGNNMFNNSNNNNMFSSNRNNLFGNSNNNNNNSNNLWNNNSSGNNMFNNGNNMFNNQRNNLFNNGNNYNNNGYSNNGFAENIMVQMASMMRDYIDKVKDSSYKDKDSTRLHSQNGNWQDQSLGDIWKIEQKYSNIFGNSYETQSLDFGSKRRKKTGGQTIVVIKQNTRSSQTKSLNYFNNKEYDDGYFSSANSLRMQRLSGRSDEFYPFNPQSKLNRNQPLGKSKYQEFLQPAFKQTESLIFQKAEQEEVVAYENNRISQINNNRSNQNIQQTPLTCYYKVFCFWQQDLQNNIKDHAEISGRIKFLRRPNIQLLEQMILEDMSSNNYSFLIKRGRLQINSQQRHMDQIYVESTYIAKKINLKKKYHFIYDECNGFKFKNLTVSNKYGRIRWPGEIDVSHVDFERDIQIGQYIQLNEEKESLREEREITMNSLPKNVEQFISDERIANQKMQEHLQKLQQKNNGIKLVSMDLKNKQYTIKIPKQQS